MKILSIRLRNLNSLRGEHLVELSAEPLASAGLFAITGTTGAGKTTLLDALTLALYGRAARYGKESNPENVMTRHCGECAAEVEFSVPSGIYRAVWERHRARKQSDGKLQPAKRYVYDAAGAVLAQQINEADALVEELIGLNYDRFLRSALLAQGDFAQFLKADANDRAALLESLTGTEIYSELGVLAHEEAGRRERGLLAKEEGISHIEVLPEDERKGMEKEAASVEKDRKKVSAEIKGGEKMRNAISALVAARKRQKQAIEDVGSVLEEKKKAVGDLERLRLHRLTLPCAEALAAFDHAASARKEAETNRETADRNLSNAREEWGKAALLFQVSLVSATKELENSLADSARQKKEAEKTAKEEKGWLQEHEKDAALEIQYDELVGTLTELKTARRTLDREVGEWKETAGILLPGNDCELNPGRDDWMEQVESVLTLVSEEDVRLTKEGKEARKEFDRRRDHLEKTEKLAAFEKHRHDLVDGESCPLCGATEHPFAEGASPDEEIRELRSLVSEAEKQLEKCREKYGEFSQARKSLVKQRDELTAAHATAASVEKQAGTLLKDLGDSVPDSGTEDLFQGKLRERVKAFRIHRKAEEDAHTFLKQVDQISETLRKEGVALQKKSSLLESVELPKGKTTSDVKPVSIDEAEDQFNEWNEKVKGLASQLETRKEVEKAARKTFEEREKILNREVEKSELSDVDSLRKARLDTEAADRIEKAAARLEKAEASALALKREAEAEIETLLAGKVLEKEKADAFLARQNELAEQNEEQLRTLTTIRNRLESDDRSRKRKEEAEKALEEEKKAIAVWRRLRELIGSHDGAKFRKYAQTISLDILSRHANTHLQRLSDRYRIRREGGETLNLEIEDRYQAGVLRPMASLSGGESFLVSLALALGLSDLAGRTVRIDSLFIDEGFGTLDPETLEVAIAALESLRQDHKTVGVISHVELLKERIGTQIVVEKKAGGMSAIRVVPEAVPVS